MLFALMAAAAAIVLAADPLPPDAIYGRAARDLAAVPQARRRVTRYLSLHGVPVDERAKFVQSLDFAVNSVSFRTQIAHPEVIGEDRLLYRIDLESLGWDREARSARRARLKLQGVDFKLSGEAERLFDDAWEAFVQKDPYWKVTQDDGKGHVTRGWLDPTLEYATRLETQSSSFILSAHWLLPRLLAEKDRGGFYSQLLMLPAKEQDLYRMFGVDIGLVDRDGQLKVGGGVLESVVALHPRHLQAIPSLYGYDEKFIWRTRDFRDEKGDDKDIFRRPGGGVKHDAGEIIGTLPNGLHWYYLADAAGNQAFVVPQDIALDKRPDPFGKIRDRNVTNADKCIDCHGPQAGIWPFIDVERQAMLNPTIALAVRSKDKRKLAEITQNLEDYYLLSESGGIERRVVRMQESYARRVEAANGLDPEANAERLLEFTGRYTWDLVRPEQAAGEMGLPLAGARDLWRLSGNDELVVLSSGQPIRRARWEEAFRAAMEAQVFPWEKVVNAKVKGH